MGSTYTDNGGIEKIGLGEQAGAWGTTTNNNFDIVDRLINGLVNNFVGTTHTSQQVTVVYLMVCLRFLFRRVTLHDTITMNLIKNCTL